jgi:hypothetical protein
MNDAPLIRMCGMYENVAKDGSTYYAGYLGGCKILLLKNKRAAEGEAPWTLLVTAMPEKGAAKPTGAAQPAAESQAALPAASQRTATPGTAGGRSGLQ